MIALHELAERSVAVEKRQKFPRTIEELQGPHAIDHLPAQGSFETFEHYFVITDSPVEPGAQGGAIAKRANRRRVGREPEPGGDGS